MRAANRAPDEHGASAFAHGSSGDGPRFDEPLLPGFPVREVEARAILIYRAIYSLAASRLPIEGGDWARARIAEVDALLRQACGERGLNFVRLVFGRAVEIESLDTPDAPALLRVAVDVLVEALREAP